MGPVLLKGDILFRDGWGEGSILMDGSNILDRSDSTGNDLNADRVIEGSILPGLLDMHTHMGDHGARGRLPVSLEETVFPEGIKHRFLRSSSEDGLIASLQASIREVHPGVTFLMDYREGGMKGLDLLKVASPIGGPMICPLARPEKQDDLRILLEESCGIGHPSLDQDAMELRKVSRDAGKLFSIHASELYRENIDDLIELEPDQVVHMISGEKEDWEALASKKVPVVVCPRSNLAYNMIPPLSRMIDAGLSLSLGTDNSLSSMQDMFREMETSWLLLRSAGYEGSDAARKIFEMAVGASLKDERIWDMLPGWTKWWEQGWPNSGDPAHLFVVDTWDKALLNKDPFSQIVRFTDRSQVIFTPSFK